LRCWQYRCHCDGADVLNGLSGHSDPSRVNPQPMLLVGPR
jgi:hypothetical protein